MSMTQGQTQRAAEAECPAREEELAEERALRAQAEAAVAQLRAVEYVTGAALSNLPLEELLGELLERIRQVLAGDRARLLLLSEDGQYLTLRAAVGLRSEVPEDVRIPVGRGIAGRIAAERQPMIVGDVAQVEVVSPLLRRSIHSFIGAPLIVEGRLIGVVDVGTIEPRHFSEDDLELLQVVADRAALAIENARLFEQAQFERSRWQATVESMLDPVAVSDARGEIIYTNRAYARFIGIHEPGPGTTEAIAQQPAYWRRGAVLTQEESPARYAALHGTEVHDLELVQRGIDGVERIAVWNAAPLRDREGRVVGAVAVGRDVTHERQADAERERLFTEVQERAAELEATIASIADGVIIYDPSGNIVRTNAAAEHLLAYSPEEMRLPIAELIAGLHLQTAEGRPLPPGEAPPQRALRGETVQGAVLVIRPGTPAARWASVSAAPIRTPNGPLLGAVATVTDITTLHALQEQREELLRTVSHDLRNPLAVIQGQAQILLRLLDKAGLTGIERHSAEAILTSSQRMNTMIQELVDSARLEAGLIRLNRQPVDLRSFVLDLKGRLAATLAVERIRVQAPEGLPPVLADPDRLERILVNLLTNALKYSTPGTEVTVTLAPQDGEIITAVTDRGPGIPPEELPHLFQRYYRGGAARGQLEGLGLGLYISRMLVEAHGGRIWAESVPGEGSTFSFSLPVA